MRRSSWALAALLFAQPNWAQDNQVPVKGELEEITVTAERREENLQKVPLTVEVITAEDLAVKHVTDPGQIQFLAPAVQLTSFDSSPGAVNFSIRGIGTLSFSNLLESAVSTVIDGIVMGRPEMGIQQFADVERIEVLEGPQGTLFGKNSSAGLINIITNSPKLGVTEFTGHIEAADVNAASRCCERQVTATANLPIGTDQALRVTAFYNGYEDLVQDVNANRDPDSNYGLSQYGFRAKYLWKPQDAVTINVGADYASSTGSGGGAPTFRSIATNSLAYPYDQTLGIVPSPFNLKRGADALTDSPFQVGGIQNEISYDLGGGLTVTNILGYRHYHEALIQDADLVPINYFDNFYSPSSFDQATDELRLTSPRGGMFDYQVGLYAFSLSSDSANNSTGDLGITTPIPAGKQGWGGIDVDNKATTHSYAVYGQTTAHVSDAFRLTGGARLTTDRDGFSGYSDISQFAIPFYPKLAITELVKATDWSGRASAEYDFTPSTMGYVTVSRGYKGPGYNIVESLGTPVGREHTINYEAGVKATALDRRLVFDLSIYDQTVKDLQVQSYDVALLNYIVRNAAEMRAKGIEAQAAYAATPDLKFSLTGAYNDAHYLNFVGGACYPGQTAAQGCANGLAQNSGNQLENAPRKTGTLNMDYSKDVASHLKGFLHADVYGRSEVNFSANADPGTRQPGYALANASIGVGSQQDLWRLSLFCRNCLDRRFSDFIETYPFGVKGDYWQNFGLNSFRSVGISLDSKF